jgi:hypothetical protein
VGARLRTIAAGRPGRALGVLAAVAVLGTAVAAGWTSRLTLSTVARSGPALQILLRGPMPAKAPAYRVAVRTMRSQLSTNQAVGSVRERRLKGDPDASLLLVRFRVSGHARDDAISGIEHALDPGPLTLSFGGSIVAVSTAKDDAIGDLYLLLFAFPLVALVAAAALGVRAAGAALIAAGAASALAALACELLGGPFDVSWLALVGATAGGTLLALQLCTLARSGTGPLALGAVAAAAAGCFGALAILGVDYLTWFGIGGALGALLAAPVALVAAGAMDGIEPNPGSPRVARAWGGIGDVVGWTAVTAVLFGLLALVLLALVALPVDRLAVAVLGRSSAPAIDATHLAIAIAAGVLVAAGIGSVAGRRAGLAVPLTLAAGLPAVAVAGLLAVTFQEGRLEALLGYTSTGAVQLGSAAGAVAVVAALGAAQAVAIAGAARAADEGKEGETRVRAAMAVGGLAATVACLAGILAGVALGFSSHGFIKQFGLGIAVGLALELLIVELLLAPAMLRLSARRAARQ